MAENSYTMATPGFGECEICTEEVYSVKLLPCNHSLCELCLKKLSESVEASKLACPQCRKGFSAAEGIRTQYFGKLSCDNCIQMKDASDCWWCTDCKKVLCSYCMVKEHKFPDHTVSEWNCLVQVDLCKAFLRNAATNVVGDSKEKNVEKLKALFEPIFHDVAEKTAAQHCEVLKQEENLNQVFGPSTNVHGNSDICFEFEDVFKLSKRIEQLTGYPSKAKDQEFGTEIDLERTVIDCQFFTSLIFKQLKLQMPEFQAAACATADPQAPVPYFDYKLQKKPEHEYWRLLTKAPSYISLVYKTGFEICFLGEHDYIIGSIEELAAHDSYVLDLVLCQLKQRIYVLSTKKENDILSNTIYECNFTMRGGVLAKFKIPEWFGSNDGFIACTETGVVYFAISTKTSGCMYDSAYILKLVMHTSGSTVSIKDAACKELFSERGSRFCNVQARHDSPHVHMVVVFEDQKKDVRIFKYKQAANSLQELKQVHVSVPIRNLFYGHDGQMVLAFGNEVWITAAVSGAVGSTIEMYTLPGSNSVLSKSKFMHQNGHIWAVMHDKTEHRILVYKVKIDKSSSVVETDR